MRFASFIYKNTPRIGVVQSDTIIILPVSMGDMSDLVKLGDEGKIAAARALENSQLVRINLSDVQLLPPLTRLRRDILCTGWNYWDHFEEGKGKREGQDVPRPDAPTFFTKAPDTLIGPNDNIDWDPRISAKWDYEAELALVIGRDGRSIPQNEALDYVWGYCLANDISQRDLQRRHGGQWLKGKSIDNTMPLGPFLVTPDELSLPDIRLECLVNGTVLQDAFVRQMAFPIAELIAELSFGMTLRAGDLLITGTPAGVGNARAPQIFLKDGDEVVVRSPELGELRNRLVRADLYGQSGIPAMDQSS